MQQLALEKDNQFPIEIPGFLDINNISYKKLKKSRKLETEKISSINTPSTRLIECYKSVE